MKQLTIEEQLERDGYVLELSVGTSMEPMLKQRREQLLIEKISSPLKNNDVVLYKRDSGQYVLHRIVSKRKSHYIIRGDNRYSNENVYPTQIIGILKGFYRGDKFIDCKENAGYVIYVVFWRLTYPFRFLFDKFLGLVRRIISRL